MIMRVQAYKCPALMLWPLIVCARKRCRGQMPMSLSHDVGRGTNNTESSKL